MIYWAQLLHFYQPPTQLPEVLQKICEESYRPLIDVFRQHPHARATVNINGVLTEMLWYYGHKDIIDGLLELAENGQIEFTGSGKYHPILPLIPRKEVERQIRLNRITNSHFFKNYYEPTGFFPPEMAYSDEIVAPVYESGYRWIILSGIACPVQWTMEKIHYIEQKKGRLMVFFRDDIISNKISFQEINAPEFVENLIQISGRKKNSYLVTAMDAETYGHHIQDWEKLFLSEVYGEIQPTMDTFSGYKQIKMLADQHKILFSNGETLRQVRMVTVSELMDIFPAGNAVEPKTSSWSTSYDDLLADNPFPLWNDKVNEIHRLLWEHLHVCNQMTATAQVICNTEESKQFTTIARGLLDRAMHSCQFWWASRRPMWDINLVHMGLINQWRVIVNAYRAINKSNVDERIKREWYHKLVAARDIRNKISDRLFIW
jgi:alpha-amylase/alpha-mannosidase (GH57 family)